MSGLKDEITAANVKFMTAYGTGDMIALSKLYTEDCKLMPTGVDVMVGRDAVINVFGGVIKAGAVKVDLKIDEVGPLGEGKTFVFERSHYTFYKEDGTVFDNGKYVVIWKNIDGTWFLYTDIFNTNSSS